jgi:iron(III) transport system ATP-binding protein
LTLSDRIAVFNKGYIEQIGTPNEVYNFSKTEFVANFIGDINRLSDEVVAKANAAGAGLDPAKHNYVRLERLHVNVEPRPGQVALPGRVTMREYYGLFIKYYIDLGSQTIKVIEKNDGVRIYEEGQSVQVVLDLADVMAYEPAQEDEVAK